jgi:hypothetical protein
VLGALRAFAVMLGGSIVLLAISAASFVLIALALARGEVPPWPAIAVAAATVAYALFARRWMRGWGSTPEERTMPLPGDETPPDPRRTLTQAVSIEAPVDRVWPWIAQLGQGRGAFYSYEWLENLAGARMRNADRIHPEWQRRTVGEKILLHPAVGLELTVFEPNRAFAMKGWGCFALEPRDGRTRLFARGRALHGAEAIYYTLLLELPHFLMQRKMLLGIKSRAERPPERPAASGTD